jgi:hypothetical protein
MKLSAFTRLAGSACLFGAGLITLFQGATNTAVILSVDACFLWIAAAAIDDIP